jgi:pyridoxine 5-phosphate synthase
MTASRLRLGVNIDHVATIRNARGGDHPDPVRAAQIAAKAGADGITAHLREDRRHITDRDIERLMAEIDLPLNLEMAATKEMLEIALRHRPHAACIVPEKREERTTEGGRGRDHGASSRGPAPHHRPRYRAADGRDRTAAEPRDGGNW